MSDERRATLPNLLCPVQYTDTVLLLAYSAITISINILLNGPALIMDIQDSRALVHTNKIARQFIIDKGVCERPCTYRLAITAWIHIKQGYCRSAIRITRDRSFVEIGCFSNYVNLSCLIIKIQKTCASVLFFYNIVFYPKFLRLFLQNSIL